MSAVSPSSQRFRLQVVIATEDVDGKVTDLRKFLHITQPERDIGTLIGEVDEKFRNLYPAERYSKIDWVADVDLSLSSEYRTKMAVTWTRPINWMTSLRSAESPKSSFQMTDIVPRDYFLQQAVNLPCSKVNIVRGENL